MSLSNSSLALIERMRPVIESASEQDIRRCVDMKEFSSWRDGDLGVANEGTFAPSLPRSIGSMMLPTSSSSA